MISCIVCYVANPNRLIFGMRIAVTILLCSLLKCHVGRYEALSFESGLLTVVIRPTPVVNRAAVIVT